MDEAEVFNWSLCSFHDIKLKKKNNNWIAFHPFMSRREGIPRALWVVPCGYSPDGCGGLLAVLSSSHIISPAPSPAPSVGSSMGDTLPWIAPAQIPSHGVQAAPARVPCRITAPAGPCSSVGLPWGHSLLQHPQGLQGRAASPPPATKTWPRSATELNSHCWDSLQQNGISPSPSCGTWWQSNDCCQSKALYLKRIIHTIFSPYQWLFQSFKNQSILPKMLSWNIHKLYMWNPCEGAGRMA